MAMRTVIPGHARGYTRPARSRGTHQQNLVLPQTLPTRSRPLTIAQSAKDDPRGVLNTCLDLLKSGSVLEMAPFLPSNLLGQGLSRLRPHPRRQHTHQQSITPDPLIEFQPLVEEVLKQRQTQFMDTYAYRNLLMTRPAYFKELSSLSITSDTFVSRCLCGSATGEEAVLTFKLKRNTPPPQEHLLNQLSDSQYMGHTDSPLHRPVQTPHWRLVSVTGEPMHRVLPRVPSPEFPPESVVQAQLQQLQEFNFAQAFSLLSPTAQTLVGPLDKFIANLGRNRQYRALVHHVRANTIIRYQHGTNTYLEVVRVVGSTAPPSLTAKPSEIGVFHYCWVLSKQQEDVNVHASKDLAHCWLTEWVKVIDDPKLLVSLGRHEVDNGEGDEGTGKGGPKRRPQA